MVLLLLFLGETFLVLEGLPSIVAAEVDSGTVLVIFLQVFRDVLPMPFLKLMVSSKSMVLRRLARFLAGVAEGVFSSIKGVGGLNKVLRFFRVLPVRESLSPALGGGVAITKLSLGAKSLRFLITSGAGESTMAGICSIVEVSVSALSTAF